MSMDNHTGTPLDLPGGWRSSYPSADRVVAVVVITTEVVEEGVGG